jgi:hypothetical protein
LQDQLSALDSLTEITSRHGYSNQVAKAEPRPNPQAHATPPAAPHPQAPAAPTQDPREMPPMELGRREEIARREPPQSQPQHHAAYPEKWASPESIEAVSAGLIERMGGSGPVNPPQQDYESMGRPPMPPMPPIAPVEMPQERRGGGGAQWSLGDLLARASEPDPFGDDDNDHAYGRPPMEPMRQPEPPAKAESSPMIFDMKDIASAVDEHVANEVWMRYNKGERHVVSRSMYNRQGQATYDQVKRRYEGDTTFRHIVDRYLADFERMLKDASKADPKGRALQQHLTSETGRIYLVLAHASGRLV